jgi:TRIAP1/MDM35 family protein
MSSDLFLTYLGNALRSRKRTRNFTVICSHALMASSLSPECTPIKHAYDKCFNSWFEGYLQPAIEESQPSNASSTSTSRNTGNGISEEETRRAYSKRKAQEFEEKCGKVWESYRACISVSVFPFHNYSILLFCKR